MKILYKTMGLGLLSACLCLLCAAPASAKVCFVGEENCTGGGSFDEYEKPDGKGALCTQDGFDTKVSDCKNDPDRQITAYCPYNNEYVKCCSKEYVYDAPCVYPLVTKGRCGNKYKCECDSSQYKYTDNECKTTKGSAGEGYENSYGSGSFCTQQRYDTDSHGIVSEIRYSSCQCDRGIYPKFGSMFPKDPSVESDCDFNAERQGPCSTKYANSNKTETYYKFCRCNTGDYPKTDAGCYPLTGDASEGSCFDTIMHYTDCASCAGYDARNLDHVPYSPGSKAVQCQKDDEGNLLNEDCDYEVCPYDQTGNTYFKIRKCNEPGYEPNSNHSACVPISCSKAVQQFLAEDGNEEYGRFDGKNLLDANGNVTKKAKYGIVAGYVTLTSSKSCSTPVTTYKSVCVSGYCATNFNSMCYAYQEGGGFCGGSSGIIGSIRPSHWCCTSVRQVATGTIYPGQGELGCSNVTRYYSPAYVVYNEEDTSSDAAKAMSVACTSAVSINANSNINGLTSTVKTYGVNWTLSGNVEKPLEIYNGKVSFSNANIKANILLTRENGKPNAGNSKVTGDLSIHSAFQSTGYDYDLGTMNVYGGSGNVAAFIAGDEGAYIKFNASRLSLKGLMALKYADAYVARSCIGCQLGGNGDPDGSGQHFSQMTLIDSNWYLAKGNTDYNLFIYPASFIGNNDGYANSGGSQIIYADNTKYAFIRSRVQYDNCHNGKSSCRKKNFSYGNVINNDGSLSYIGDGYCSRWCDSANDGSDYGNDRICAVNGSKMIWGHSGSKKCWIEAVWRSDRY